MKNLLVTEMRCALCQKSYQPDQIRYTCPDCGTDGILEVLYDYGQAAPSMQPKALRQAKPGLSRYAAILPIANPSHLPPLRVGGTPLYHPQRLGHLLDCPNLYVKDDGQNPTGSFKDRASAICVASALDNGIDLITAASTGNAASSLSGLCASVGLKTIIFVPEHAPQAKVTQLLMFGATVLKVRGTYDDAFELSMQATAKFGWYNRNTGFNPFLLEGKKTAALELWEDFGYRVPEYVAVGVGDGCIIGGLWKGFKDLQRLGLIDKLPKLIGVQAEGSSVLSKAFKNGDKVVAEPDADTYADSISVGMPRAAAIALKGVRDSGGFFITVPDSKIMEAQVMLAKYSGVFGEPAGATPLAGIRRCLEEKLIDHQAEICVLVTGNGLKDISGAMKSLTVSAYSIDRDPSKLETSLKELHIV
ncbi:MAG: threonine synthase [bacterium]|nr:threonine synthase [bacterium]